MAKKSQDKYKLIESLDQFKVVGDEGNRTANAYELELGLNKTYRQIYYPQVFIDQEHKDSYKAFVLNKIKHKVLYFKK